MLPSFYQRIKDRHSLLALGGLAHLVLFAILLLAILLDQRSLLGINIWVKPAKFAISIAIYLWTFAFLIHPLPYSEKKKNLFARIAFFVMLFEMVAIVVQAARGVQSHFNISSLQDALLFQLMGIAIMINFVLLLVVTFDYFSKKVHLNSAYHRALQFGLIAMILSNIGGITMSVLMRHTVGMPDGGEGLPFVNWSTVAGDLRVMHFVGAHGLQLLPFLVWLNIQIAPKTSLSQITNQITVIGILYLMLVLITFVQAMVGMPLF